MRVLRFCRRGAFAVSLTLSTTACNVDWNRVLQAFAPKKTAAKPKGPVASSSAATGSALPHSHLAIVDDKPRALGARVDLGSAHYPATAQAAHAIHDFTVSSVSPTKYELTFVSTPDAQNALEDAYRAYANSVNATAVTGQQYKWQPPPGCEHDDGCVLQALADQNHDALVPIIALFAARQRAARLSSNQLAAMVVAFVQDIPYYEPDEEPFGILAPGLVVSRKLGDCDSKSLLAHLILEALGFDTVFISSDAHHHAMLGIALPVAGDRFVFQGRQYAFVELTAAGAPIGYQAPETKTPNDWRVVPLRHPTK